MPKPRKSSFDEGYIAIIARLIARRRELKITQEQLATAYGETQSFISSVERRQRRIDVWEFVRFCTLLKLDPGEVLGGTSATIAMRDAMENMLEKLRPAPQREAAVRD